MCREHARQPRRSVHGCSTRHLNHCRRGCHIGRKRRESVAERQSHDPLAAGRSPHQCRPPSRGDVARRHATGVRGQHSLVSAVAERRRRHADYRRRGEPMAPGRRTRSTRPTAAGSASGRTGNSRRFRPRVACPWFYARCKTRWARAGRRTTQFSSDKEPMESGGWPPRVERPSRSSR